MVNTKNITDAASPAGGVLIAEMALSKPAPSLAALDLADGLSVYAEAAGRSVLGRHQAYLADLIRRKPARAVPTAKRLPPLHGHISHVVVVRAEEQMVRVHAGAIIATVEHLKAGRDHASMSRPRQPVGQDPASGPTYTTIGLLGNERTSPQPASAIWFRHRV